MHKTCNNEHNADGEANTYRNAQKLKIHYMSTLISPKLNRNDRTIRDCPQNMIPIMQNFKEYFQCHNNYGLHKNYYERNTQTKQLKKAKTDSETSIQNTTMLKHYTSPSQSIKYVVSAQNPLQIGKVNYVYATRGPVASLMSTSTHK